MGAALDVSRGYAAIAMDTCGCLSGGGYDFVGEVFLMEQTG